MIDSDRPFDLIRIAEVLARHEVAYVTIGGVCGLLHGAVDYLTRDVDVLARSDERTGGGRQPRCRSSEHLCERASRPTTWSATRNGKRLLDESTFSSLRPARMRRC